LKDRLDLVASAPEDSNGKNRANFTIANINGARWGVVLLQAEATPFAVMGQSGCSEQATQSHPPTWQYLSTHLTH